MRKEVIEQFQVMSKYDFGRRLKLIVSAECSVTKSESRIAQKVAKYSEKLSAINTSLVKQKQELKKYRNDCQKLVHENGKLQQLKQEEDDQLIVLLRKLEQLEVEYNKILQNQIQQNRTLVLQMDYFRNVKLATQTYIKVHALPELITGVAVSEKDSSSQWNSFCIDPLNHSPKEVEISIWPEANIDSELRKTWETLIFGDILSDECKFTEFLQK